MRQKKEVIQSIETLLKQIKKCVNLDELYQELQKFKKIFTDQTKGNNLGSQIIGALKIYDKSINGRHINKRSTTEIVKRALRKMKSNTTSYKDFKDEILELKRRGQTYKEIQSYVVKKTGKGVSISTLTRLFRQERDK